MFSGDVYNENGRNQTVDLDLKNVDIGFFQVNLMIYANII